MSKEPVRVRAFVGFQIHSEFYKVKDYELLMKSSCDLLRKENGIALEVKYGEFQAGRILWNELINAIRWADIGIFDISENNPNVMFEAGLALGLERHIVTLKNKKSTSIYPKPSDLAQIYIPYDNKDRLNSPETRKKVTGAIGDYVENTHKSEYLFKNIWGFSENDEVTVICSELPEAEHLMFPEPHEFIRLGKYGDGDAFLEVLITLHCLYKNLHVKHYTGNEVKDMMIPLTGNIVLIGGPDYNITTRIFEEYSPYKYKCGIDDNDIYLSEKRSKTEYRPNFTKSGGHQKVQDWGFFMKIRNPYNREKRLVMIGGPHTYGVFGAARVFSYKGDTKGGMQYQNCKIVSEKLGDNPEFCVHFKVEAIDQKVQDPQIENQAVAGMKPMVKF